MATAPGTSEAYPTGGLFDQEPEMRALVANYVDQNFSKANSSNDSASVPQKNLSLGAKAKSAQLPDLSNIPKASNGLGHILSLLSGYCYCL